MSDQAPSNNNNQAILYALVAIAVLLAAIVGFMIYQRTSAIPGPTGAAPSSSSAVSAGVPAGMGGSGSTGSASTGSASIAPVAFDPKTATKLTGGLTPDAALKAYNDAVLANQYDKAYALLPLAQKQSYASAESMATQIKQYGITGFKVGTPTTNGADTSFVVETDTPAMNITYTWTFTKVGSDWFIKSRTMGGTL